MRLFFCFLFLLTCFTCSENEEDENCKFLLNVGVNVPVNLNLPEYGQLQYTGNSVYIPNEGNAGIIVANINSSFYAWDASDPNYIPNTCSPLVPSGLEASSNCGNGNTYSLATGTPLYDSTLRCSLKFYPVKQTGNTLYITN
ncbi:hypothetical protein APS56_12170 [Pseudalgibacter alginicilyticus]|uniref:Rieske domain-containing protein n=1 Tax=Pseudalgibacter alginicilyticus TaxID=1736674 RepID=A0A0P0CSN0_9FLAO|nr:hypothetical protein [Pseudalgibacter alginicilyticus]ALJ05837.1 hypothetical protein APS56_12170 [Pseudalgibacter alginicilyticus]